MFKFSSWITFTMNICNLFKFKSSFKCCRIVKSTTYIEEVFCIFIFFCNCMYFIFIFKKFFCIFWDFFKFIKNFLIFTKICNKKIDTYKLTNICFCCSNTYLRSCSCIYYMICFTCY